MENNEIMNYEDDNMMIDDIELEEASGVSTGVAMLIGAGLTVAVGAAVKFGKKAIAAYKAKKEVRKPEKVIEVEAEKVEEVATEE